MKLIREEIENVEVIVEERGGKKNLYIEGVFLQGDIKNRNGRMYPCETLAKEVSRYNEAFITKGRALGELGHPDGPTVNLDRVSHKITSLRQEGSDFIGRAKILTAPALRRLQGSGRSSQGSSFSLQQGGPQGWPSCSLGSQQGWRSCPQLMLLGSMSSLP